MSGVWHSRYVRRQALLAEQAPVRARKLEINAVEHCNLSCRSCSHLSPVQPRYAVDPDEVHRDLRLLGRHYHARWLRLVGGEPLLHPDLPRLLEAIRSSGVADRTVVVTNGVLLPRVQNLVWASVDRIDVSQYPGKRLGDTDVERCKQLARRHGVRIYFDYVDEFRVSYSESGANSEALVDRIYSACAIAHELACHTVARGYFYKCPQSYFLPRTIPGVGASSDRLAISDRPELGAELRAFLAIRKPLAACRNCLGTAGMRFTHDQVRRGDFRMTQAPSSEALVDERYLRRRHVASRTVLAAVRERVGREAH